MATLLCCFALSAPASAQTKMADELGVVGLNSEQSIVDLKGKVFLFEDKFKKYNLAMAWKEINSNAEGYLAKTNTLRMVQPSSSYWLLFRINNQSDVDRWILDFGDSVTGRSGFVHKIMAYDITAQKLILKIFGNENKSTEKSDNLIESAITLDLPIGKTTQIMFYIEPAAKKPFIIAPSLTTKAQYFSRGMEALDRQEITIYVYLALFFMMLTFTLIYRKPHQLFGTLFLFFGLAHYLIENTLLYLDNEIYEQALFFTYIFTQISVFYVFYNYFYDRILSTTTVRKISLLAPLLCILITAFSVFAVPDDIAYLVFLVAVSIIALTTLFLFAVNLTSKVLVKYLFIILGFSYTLAYWVGSVVIEFPIDAYATYINYGYVYGQLALSLALILSMPIRRPTSSKSAAPLSGLGKNVFQGSSNYKDSKDMADRERLLRVLDRERELLEEARAREAQKTDEMRKAKDTADEANQAKSAFLAVISHEIRTPITGVLGMVKLLLTSQMTAVQKDYAQTIQDSGDAMLSLLNDILDYEKIESGKLDLEFISFDVKRMMQGIERLMTSHAESKGVGLVLAIEDNVPDYLVGDPTRLRQVVLNLLSNAIKFTEHGDVHIIVKKIDMGTADTARVVGLSGSQQVHSIYFGVQDSGIGLSADAQKTLFTPFTQAKAETTRKYGGTGLGLSICQKLINAMGGEISINSKEHEGSTFFFTVDMQEGDAQEAQSEEANFDLKRNTEHSYRVLAVDDNSINLKVLNGFIDKLGHECIKVESGEEAIIKLQEEYFDMILTDVNMHGISGLEMTKHIRAMQHAELSAIPIVALTGNSGQEAVHECYHAGMDDFILKPVNPKSLNGIFTKLEKSEFANEVTSERYKAIRERRIVNKASNEVVITIVDEDSELSQNDVVNIEHSLSATQGVSIDKNEFSAPLDVNELPPLPSERDTMGSGPAELDSDTGHDSEDDVLDIELGLNVSPLQQFVTEEQGDNVSAAPDVYAIVADNLQKSMVEENPSFVADIEARGVVFEASLLEALKLSMDNAELTSLVDGFDEKAQEILQGIQEAYETKDWTSLAQRAHEMKGMSGNFGLRALSEFMKELEVIVKTKKFDGIEYFIVRIPIAYNLGIKQIRAWIAG
jgi:signal transduction histidine kinase/DNA-binding NarL/FixJ family response regulator/HPt (histidine-containing phosphotransfer) domain-containing protein